MRTWSFAAFLFAAAGCTSTPGLPPGSGAGLVAFDPTPPAGAQLWQQPTLRAGDRYVLRRGGKVTISFTVGKADDSGYELVDERGGRFRRGRDLSNVGEWPAAGEQALHELSPPDCRFHWPLWIGKHWRCQYVDRTAGGPALPVESSYEVEDLDTVVTPAGTFKALRILRTSRLMLEGGGSYLDKVMVIWYAPDLGLEVRQVFGDTSVELAEWHPAQAGGA